MARGRAAQYQSACFPPSSETGQLACRNYSCRREALRRGFSRGGYSALLEAMRCASSATIRRSRIRLSSSDFNSFHDVGKKRCVSGHARRVWRTISPGCTERRSANVTYRSCAVHSSSFLLAVSTARTVSHSIIVSRDAGAISSDRTLDTPPQWQFAATLPRAS